MTKGMILVWLNHLFGWRSEAIKWNRFAHLTPRQRENYIDRMAEAVTTRGRSYA